MKKKNLSPSFLGIEGGGTRTVAVLADVQGREVQRVEAGPANLRLLSDAQLIAHFRALQPGSFSPAAIAVGLAGARTKADRERIRRAAARVWPGISCHATNDLETALMAAEHHALRITHHPSTRVLVLSGTGSCCFGRTEDGKTIKVGGWGHILGDKGSGYEIGLRALKAVVYYYDRDGIWSNLGQRLLRTLQLNEPDDLIGWVQGANKMDVAALAVEVFAAWANGDKIASDILDGAAHSLAKDAVNCARRLVKAQAPVQFILAGGVLVNQPPFAKKVARLLRRLCPTAIVTPLKCESVWGAVELARRQWSVVSGQWSVSRRKIEPVPERTDLPPIESMTLSPTEQRHPRSRNLDRMSIAAAIRLMLSEDAKIPAALLAERKKIERGIKLIIHAFKKGGRLFYVGAGTSGRLGILDASECPPTFRTAPEQVQGIIAGGQRAIWESVEGAEDDADAGARSVVFRGVSMRDVVVGIAASGRTPFVWGALGEARRRGATTILICFNSALKIPHQVRPHLVVGPDVGPEILTGSTRLKAGTATKLILNIFTTLAMVRMGKVMSNLMVDVKPANSKLRDRAARIVQELATVDYPTAQAALESSGWVIKNAAARLRRHK